jgi:hypothetical protein
LRPDERSAQPVNCAGSAEGRIAPPISAICSPRRVTLLDAGVSKRSGMSLEGPDIQCPTTPEMSLPQAATTRPRPISVKPANPGESTRGLVQRAVTRLRRTSWIRGGGPEVTRPPEAPEFRNVTRTRSPQFSETPLRLAENCGLANLAAPIFGLDGPFLFSRARRRSLPPGSCATLVRPDRYPSRSRCGCCCGTG